MQNKIKMALVENAYIMSTFMVKIVSRGLILNIVSQNQKEEILVKVIFVKMDIIVLIMTSSKFH